MITVELEEYPGVDAILNNIDTYKDKFLKETIVGFRNAYCNREDQQKIFYAFGDALGWYPNSDNPVELANYEETHHSHMNSGNTIDKDKPMLGWHLEHVLLKNDTFLGASWCMNLFKCEPGAGYTYFIDMAKLHDSLSDDDKDFLSSTVASVEITKGDKTDLYENKVVQHHWVLGDKIIRLHFMPNSTSLKSIEGRTPTQDEETRFDSIINNIMTQVYENRDIVKVQEWQEGDMLILDMFKLAHAVGGGFKQNERQLDGIFGHLNPNFSSQEPKYS